MLDRSPNLNQYNPKFTLVHKKVPSFNFVHKQNPVRNPAENQKCDRSRPSKVVTQKKPKEPFALQIRFKEPKVRQPQSERLTSAKTKPLKPSFSKAERNIEFRAPTFCRNSSYNKNHYQTEPRNDVGGKFQMLTWLVIEYGKMLGRGLSAHKKYDYVRALVTDGTYVVTTK